MSELADGTYDVMVVEAEEQPDGAISLELAVSSGPHRGEVVTLVARNLARSWVDLLATPAMLTVADGQPSLTFD